MFTVGVDIVGMSVKVGLVDRNGKIINQCREKTAPTPDEVIKKISEQIFFLLKEENLTVEDLIGIGIGCPGAVTSETGMVAFLPNLGWRDVPIADKLNEYINVPVKISNDANVAALGEAIYGCAKDYDTSVMFTLGTGVGGGIILNKKLYEGGHSRGAELGHMTLIMDGEPCTCGRNGCIECYVSATALMKQTKEEMNNNPDSLMWKQVGGDINKVDGKTAFDCAEQGDASAQKVRNNYIKYLSESVLNMLNIFRPDAFILGGGISAQGKVLTDAVTEYCEKFNYGYEDAPKTKILTATLGNDAGIIGAAALFDE